MVVPRLPSPVRKVVLLDRFPEREAVGTPDATFSKANFALPVALLPSKRSCVEIRSKIDPFPCSNGEPPLATEPEDANAIRGVLQRVAVTDREIVTVGPNSKGEEEVETTISVPQSASITRDGQPIKFEDLKEGQSVIVHADSRNGKIVAKVDYVFMDPTDYSPMK